MRYCEKYNCGNVLQSIAKNDELIYRCPVCFQEYLAVPEDTLMIDEYLQENDTTYRHKNYLKNAHNDTISELERKNCANSKCSETIVRVIKVAKNGQVLYVCPTCKTQFA
jgi:DNA-directed RNA polymerase subunit M/transcription elongation factor TFIIS